MSGSGGHGKEPIIRVIGRNPDEVADKIIMIKKINQAQRHKVKQKFKKN
ncbi:hypothetical protein HY745_11475 [Candidatus Desantisbacteria bacterium]|nr:hypothetical protein [Candidatus Desantisbacteria bacterium]